MELWGRVTGLEADYILFAGEREGQRKFYFTLDGISWVPVPEVTHIDDLEQLGYGLDCTRPFFGKPDMVLRQVRYASSLGEWANWESEPEEEEEESAKSDEYSDEEAAPPPPKPDVVTEIMRLARVVTAIDALRGIVLVRSRTVAPGPTVIPSTEYAGLMLSEAAQRSAWSPAEALDQALLANRPTDSLLGELYDVQADVLASLVFVTHREWPGFRIVYRVGDTAPRTFYDGNGLYGLESLWQRPQNQSA